MFSSGLLIQGKNSLSNLVGMGSSIQVDDLDEDNFVASCEGQLDESFPDTHRD